MTVFALDDERNMLLMLENAIQEAVPRAKVLCFSRSNEALKHMDESTVRPDVAFLDIEMPGMDGLELAKRIKEHNPQANIVFVTGFAQYALEAISLYPSGYIMKPVTTEKVKKEIDNLRYPIAQAQMNRVRAQCFGNFELLVDDLPVQFRYAKTKELFAYLVDRRGAAVNTAEIIGILWEDSPDTPSLRSQCRNLISDLTQTLRALDSEDVFIKNRNSFSVNVKKISCDMYRFLDKDIAAISAYGGEYMAQYSWAEMTLGFLHARTNNNIF